MFYPAVSPRLADHPVDAQFLTRWSPRAFADDAMPEPVLLTILEAARWAPSSSNLQPWRFAYGLRGDDGFGLIAAALVPSNRIWAAKAAALVAIASCLTVLRQGEAVANPSHAFDTGAAWAHLGLQARVSGYVAHAMGGFDKARAAEGLQLPQGHELHAVVAIGRQAPADSLPEDQRAREVPNGRLPLTQTARRGKFV